MGGLAFGLLDGLFVGLVGGLGRSRIATRIVPNEGMHRSARSALVSGLFVGLVFGLTIGLGGRLMNGGLACIQHLVLRALLWRNGSAPLNYVHFLDYAAERIFLRKVGGGYIFIHRLLQEYFAGLEAETLKH